jgi:succinoglycan biosynthesis transport protein ExoP
MSLDERSLLSDDQSSVQALALTQASTLTQPSGSMTRLPQEGTAQMVAAADLATYVHAFRRHWVLSLGLGLILAPAIGLGVWFGMGPWYTARHYLRVAYQEQNLVRSGQQPYEPEYEIFKNTQLQLIMNRFMLSSALRRPEENPISRLPILKNQKDQVGWLLKNLSVSFPGKAEVMEVSLTTYDPKEAAAIVTAVVDAYMNEVVESEKDQKRVRLSELDRVWTDRDQEVRNKRNELKTLADQLGTAVSENLNLKQRLTMEELATYRQELARSEFELGRLRAELAAREAELDAVKNLDISDIECELFAQYDQSLRNLIQEIQWRKMDAQYTSGALASSSKSAKLAGRYEGEMAGFQRDYEERIGQIRDEIRHKRQSEVEREIKRVKASIEVANKQMQANDRDVQRLKSLAEQYGGSSVDVEMLRADIENREKSLASIAAERERVRIELRSNPRVIRYGGAKAEEPPTPSNTPLRIAATCMASLLALCLPALGITWWDTRFQRVNTANEIRDRLGIPVIGSLPVIPSRVLRQLGSPSKRNQLWQLRLTESVDGITARLLRRAELEQRRVVMVTSAVSGEGKTTLAAQIAMSLARAGRRTVLVDFDLRQPSFDDAFGLPSSPGVCEILRSESDLPAAIQSTATPNLSVITAGRWNRMALSALANGGAYSFFKELRDDYEFVIVDTSPILPIADARFVSQYVDSVVLCVFCDISESPRIRAACEILEAFGVQSIEAAVAGKSEGDTKRSGYYHSSVPA